MNITFFQFTTILIQKMEFFCQEIFNYFVSQLIPLYQAEFL